MKSLPKITENEFQTQVISLARLLGWKVAHFRSVRVQRANGSIRWQTPVQGDGAGFPDLILVRGSRLLVVELKVPPNKCTPEQEDWLEAFRNAGREVFVWTPADWPQIELSLGKAA